MLGVRRFRRRVRGSACARASFESHFSQRMTRWQLADPLRGAYANDQLPPKAEA